MNTSEILGHWVLDPEDQSSLERLGMILLSFSPEGILTYTILGEQKDQVIILTYEIQGNKIITDQPSHPNRIESRFSLQNEVLELEFEGYISRFIRLPDEMVE